MFNKKIFTFLFASVASLSAWSQSPPAVNPGLQASFFLGAGFTAGGDTLATAYYKTGGSVDVTAGGVIDMKLGMDFRINPNVSVQGNVGYHVHNASAKNGDIRFSRVPIEALVFWHVNDKFRLGAGVRKATGANLSGSGVASNVGSTNFNASTGSIVQGEYFFTSKDSVAVRYVTEKYTPQKGFSKINGSHGGVLYFHYF